MCWHFLRYMPQSSSKTFELQAFPARLLGKTSLELARRLAVSHRMTGDPTKALGGPPENEDEDAKDEESEDLTYREIHHLAYMVWLIDNNTSVVPSNSFIFDAVGNLVPNPAFSGGSKSFMPHIFPYCASGCSHPR